VADSPPPIPRRSGSDQWIPATATFYLSRKAASRHASGHRSHRSPLARPTKTPPRFGSCVTCVIVVTVMTHVTNIRQTQRGFPCSNSTSDSPRRSATIAGNVILPSRHRILPILVGLPRFRRELRRTKAMRPDSETKLYSGIIAKTPNRNRTCNLPLRRRLLYPVELWGLVGLPRPWLPRRRASIISATCASGNAWSTRRDVRAFGR